MPNYSLGKKIKAIRDAMGLNQKDFAHKLGVHLQTLSRYERGEIVPGGDVLSKVNDIEKQVAQTGILQNTSEGVATMAQTGTGEKFHVKGKHQYADEAEKPIHQLLESSGVLNIGNMINRVRRDGSVKQNERLDNASDEFVREVLGILDEIKGKAGKQKKTAG